MTLPPVPRRDAGFWKAHWRVGEALARMEPRVALALGGVAIPHLPVCFVWRIRDEAYRGARMGLTWPAAVRTSARSR